MSDDNTAEMSRRTSRELIGGMGVFILSDSEAMELDGSFLITIKLQSTHKGNEFPPACAFYRVPPLRQSRSNGEIEVRVGRFMKARRMGLY